MKRGTLQTTENVKDAESMCAFIKLFERSLMKHDLRISDVYFKFIPDYMPQEGDAEYQKAIISWETLDREPIANYTKKNKKETVQ